jgi:putative endonuclease
MKGEVSTYENSQGSVILRSDSDEESYPPEILRFAQNDSCGEPGKMAGVKPYYVYIMTNKSRTLYTGVTNDLERRVYEHKHKLIPGFTTKYNLSRLVYFEATEDIRAAIEREKQIKGWLRRKKLSLIASVNPKWEDLSSRFK